MAEMEITVHVDSFKNPKLVFELITNDNHYKIYSNGFVDAVDKTKKCVAINRLQNGR